VLLPYPTSITGDLIKAGVKMAEELFEEGKKYVKGGIILGGLVPDDSIQGNFFESEKNNRRSLMHMLDNINFSMRDDIVKFASSGLQRNWKMRQELRSPRYTTRWNELHNIR
jgi:DNA polymerase V